MQETPRSGLGTQCFRVRKTLVTGRTKCNRLHDEGHGQQTRPLTQTQQGRAFEVPLPHKSLKVAPAKALFTQPMFCTGFLPVSVGASAAENR